MNRGRGRWGRGGGGGRSGGGPRLPAKLSKELFGEDGSAGHRVGRSIPRKDRRKLERQQAKRDSRKEQQPPPQRHGLAPEGRPSKRQRLVERGRAGASGPSKAPSGSMFSALVPAAGLDAEQQLQRELAKKLGLKKGKKEKSLEDGLDDLLDGFASVEDGLDPGSDEGEPGQQQQLQSRHKQPRKRQGRALYGGSDSDSSNSGDSADDMGSEGAGDDIQEEGGSDLEDMLLGESDSESELDGEVLAGDGGGGSRRGGGGSESDSEGDADGSSSEDDGDRFLGSDSDLLHGSGSDEEGSEVEEEGDGSGGSGGEQEGQAAGSAAPAAAGAAAAGAAGRGLVGGGGGAGGGKYVPPAARRGAGGEAGQGDEAGRVGRRVRGLLNRLAEANIKGIVGDLAALYEEEGRRLVSDAVCAELLAAAAEGPRASDRFAAVTAAAVAGLAAAAHNSEIVANFLDRLAARLEAASAEGDSLASHNLAMVAANLFSCGAVRADLLYSLLNRLKARFGDGDVSLLATLLRACGLQLRAADPLAMKEFVVSVHARAAEAGGAAALSKRGQSMLELVVDIKNNRKRGGDKSAASLLAPAISKWLRSAGVSEVAVGGIAWDKILMPNKKGIWWLPTAADAVHQEPAARAALKAAAAGAGDHEGGVAGPELLKLAAQLRMNTDVRRAVFCIVMGSEDYVDAFEKLLRLPLKVVGPPAAAAEGLLQASWGTPVGVTLLGEAEREVVRVAVECCLQERAWNPYYSLLLAKLCQASKSHKITLQYCLWDQIKEVAGGGLEVRRMTNLARLLAAVISGGGLPSTTLKVVEFAEGMGPKEVLFWRIFFEHLLLSAKSRQEVAALFQKIAAQPQLKQFKTELAVFLRRTFGPWVAAKEPGPGTGLSDEQLASLLGRLQAAERALGTRDFLDLLVSVGALDRTGPVGEERYTNSAEAAAFLVQGVPEYIGGYVKLDYDRTFPHMMALEEALSTGEVSAGTLERLGLRDLQQVFKADPDAGLHFAQGMSSVSLGNFRALAQRFDFSRFAALTDVGGSLGTLCVEVCKQHPGLRARSCDLPILHEAARKNVAAHQLSDRVEIVDVDMFDVEQLFPPSDVITMSQILHDWGLPKKKLLIKKAYEALAPGGALVVAERMIDEDRRSNTTGLAQSLVMLLNFGREDAFDYTFSEFRTWTEEAGFQRWESLPLLPDWTAAVAYK
ncbi:hypothetical protein N2152v2_009757 [Parachlorella kessleri]